MLKTLIKACGAVKLDRGGKDVGALKNAVSLVKSGRMIAIFPQGHRFPGENPADTPVKSGIGHIAYHAHADILPVCIRAKDVKYKLFRKKELIIGKPIKYSELGFENGGREEYMRAMNKVFDNICSLGGYKAELPEAPCDESENKP